MHLPSQSSGARGGRMRINDGGGGGHALGVRSAPGVGLLPGFGPRWGPWAERGGAAASRVLRSRADLLAAPPPLTPRRRRAWADAAQATRGARRAWRQGWRSTWGGAAQSSRSKDQQLERAAARKTARNIELHSVQCISCGAHDRGLFSSNRHGWCLIN